MKVLWQLFASFLKVGLMTFGGGLAMFPMLEREIIDRRGWCTRDEIVDYYAIGQCTPGIIAVTVSALIGWQQKKMLGAIVGPIAVALPGFVIVLILSFGLNFVIDHPIAQAALAGMRVAVAALVTAAVVNIFRSQVKRWWQLLIAVAAFIPVALLGAHPAWVVASAALIGLFGAWKNTKKD
ncbi:MAG: chromate transporter [Oscillospiraceae bacterium]|nr:chromate transporter [Oscillospiraceae bacterium]